MITVYRLAALLAVSLIAGFGIYYSIRLLFRLVLWFMSKHVEEEYYKNAPRVDTNLCDKGHVYPSDQALKLTDIPGLEADVPICPLCYDINMKTAEKLLTELKTADTKGSNERAGEIVRQ